MSDQLICAVHGRPWRHDRGMANGILGLHCGWDGSLHPDTFMELLEKPGTCLTPTDKNYKVYIEIEDAEGADELRVISRGNSPSFGEGWQRVRDVDLSKVDTDGWREFDPEEWIQLSPRGTKRTDKFYFEHLDDEQRKRFVELLNDGKLALDFPGRFYVLPFFVGAGK